MSGKQKHLKFIQNAINRMTGNSFLIKGWTVLLASALFAFYARQAYTAVYYWYSTAPAQDNSGLEASPENKKS